MSLEEIQYLQLEEPLFVLVFKRIRNNHGSVPSKTVCRAGQFPSKRQSPRIICKDNIFNLINQWYTEQDSHVPQDGIWEQNLVGQAMKCSGKGPTES